MRAVLDERLRCLVSIRAEQVYDGRKRYEASMIGEDGQTLYIYEGQLKEVAEELEVGKQYTFTFRPFVNNRWIELKLIEAEVFTRSE